jgi:hypothetical protein
VAVPFWNIDCNVRMEESVEGNKKRESRKNFKMIFYSVIHSWAVIAGLSGEGRVYAGYGCSNQ